MKVLFVHPGPLLYTNVFLRLEPLGLELVAEAARCALHAVKLIDLQVESHADYHRMIAEWRRGMNASVSTLPQNERRSFRERLWWFANRQLFTQPCPPSRRRLPAA